jgi:hypothetical protein
MKFSARAPIKQVGHLHQVGNEVGAPARAQIDGNTGRQPQVSLDEALLGQGNPLRRERLSCGRSKRGYALPLSRDEEDASCRSS